MYGSERGRHEWEHLGKGGRGGKASVQKKKKKNEVRIMSIGCTETIQIQDIATMENRVLRNNETRGCSTAATVQLQSEC